MNEPAAILIERSIQIAWDYLDRTGDLGEPETAARVLLDTVLQTMRQGEHRPLMLSNMAIDAYKRFRSERRIGADILRGVKWATRRSAAWSRLHPAKPKRPRMPGPFHCWFGPALPFTPRA
jgi:hypothetical protein